MVKCGKTLGTQHEISFPENSRDLPTGVKWDAPQVFGFIHGYPMAIWYVEGHYHWQTNVFFWLQPRYGFTY